MTRSSAAELLARLLDGGYTITSQLDPMGGFRVAVADVSGMEVGLGIGDTLDAAFAACGGNMTC